MIRPPLRIVLHGASGRMGQALRRLAALRPDVTLAAEISRQPPDAASSNAWLPPSALGDAPDFDVLIDFSMPQAFDSALHHVVARNAIFVSGTTGLSEAQFVALSEAATHAPVLWAANFSLGVAVLEDLVRRTAAALPGWSCDVVEAHHVHKRDAPSGTALTLGRAAALARGAEPHYASLRAGDIVGEHMVQFAGLGERIELVHRATDRDIFARGALECATRLHGRAPGRYSISDLLLGVG
jgi:4-hydroxy-tetrahydrodipicolinate reductase